MVSLAVSCTISSTHLLVYQNKTDVEEEEKQHHGTGGKEEQRVRERMLINVRKKSERKINREVKTNNSKKTNKWDRYDN